MTIVVKYDHQLSRREIDKIFLVYNECFYDGKVTKNKQIKQAKIWLAKSHIFQWYLLKLDDDIVGIANYVYDYTNAANFSIQQDKGENVSSLGVRVKYQRQGYARQLMDWLINDHPNVDLVVEIKKGNPQYEKLIKFYNNLGFKLMSYQESDEDNIYLKRNEVTDKDQTPTKMVD